MVSCRTIWVPVTSTSATVNHCESIHTLVYSTWLDSHCPTERGRGKCTQKCLSGAWKIATGLNSTERRADSDSLRFSWAQAHSSSKQRLDWIEQCFTFPPTVSKDWLLIVSILRGPWTSDDGITRRQAHVELTSSRRLESLRHLARWFSRTSRDRSAKTAVFLL